MNEAKTLEALMKLYLESKKYWEKEGCNTETARKLAKTEIRETDFDPFIMNEYEDVTDEEEHEQGQREAEYDSKTKRLFYGLLEELIK